MISVLIVAITQAVNNTSSPTINERPKIGVPLTHHMIKPNIIAKKEHTVRPNRIHVFFQFIVYMIYFLQLIKSFQVG